MIAFPLADYKAALDPLDPQSKRHVVREVELGEIASDQTYLTVIIHRGGFPKSVADNVVKVRALLSFDGGKTYPDPGHPAVDTGWTMGVMAGGGELIPPVNYDGPLLKNGEVAVTVGGTFMPAELDAPRFLKLQLIAIEDVRTQVEAVTDARQVVDFSGKPIPHNSVGFDSVSTAFNMSAALTGNLTHTATGGTNNCGILTAGCASVGAATLTGVWGGAAMTAIDSTVAAHAGNAVPLTAQAFRKTAAATGAQTVSLNSNNALYGSFGSVYFTGVNQTAPTNGAVHDSIADTTARDATANVTSDGGCFTVSVGCFAGPGSGAPTMELFGNKTVFQDKDHTGATGGNHPNGSYVGHAQYSAGANPVTMSVGNTRCGSFAFLAFNVQEFGVSVHADLASVTAVGLPATVTAFPQFIGFADFDFIDGVSSGGYSRVAPASMTAYPFWVAHTQRLIPSWVAGHAASGMAYASDYTGWSCEVPNGPANGTYFRVFHNVPRMGASDGISFSEAVSLEASLSNPYWETFICEFRSATDRRLYRRTGEGTYVRVDDGSNTTSRAIDITGGSPTPSPILKVRERANPPGGTYSQFAGGFCRLIIGTGTLGNTALSNLCIWGGDYPNTVSPTGGAVTEYYPLDVDGRDVVGGHHLTKTGTVNFDTGAPQEIPSPTTAEAINWIFKQSTLPSYLPTVTPGQLNNSPSFPINTAGWANIADLEFLDISYPTNVRPGSPTRFWTGRIYHYVPAAHVIPGGHVVFVDGGHEYIEDFDIHLINTVVQTLVAIGYGVALTIMPQFDPRDPDYTAVSDHNNYFLELTPTANPIEFFLAPTVIAMNNLAPRYGKRSITGLSGGGWKCPHYAALDDRLNHAVVPVRGTIADRRLVGNKDFEQQIFPNGWKVEEFYRLCASRGLRLWFDHHPTDQCCFGQLDTGGGSGSGGAYLDAADYDTTFLAPLRAEFPLADVRMFIDTGTDTHAYNAYSINTVLLPALSGALLTPPDLRRWQNYGAGSIFNGGASHIGL